MKKKSTKTALTLLVVAALFLTGCGASPTASEPKAAESTPVQAETPKTPAAVEVDEGLLKVDISIRRDLLDPEGEKSDEELAQGAKDKGMKAKVNDDGTVTYTMTRNQQRELLSEMRKGMDESTAELVEDKSNPFTAVEYNKAMTRFTVKVDKSRYSELDAFYMLGFYIQGGIFQQFSGVKGEDLDVVVKFVDKDTGETIQKGSMRDWLDS